MSEIVYEITTKNGEPAVQIRELGHASEPLTADELRHGVYCAADCAGGADSAERTAWERGIFGEALICLYLAGLEGRRGPELAGAAHGTGPSPCPPAGIGGGV